MYNRVLVRSDSSGRTKPAVEYALIIAADQGATVYVLDTTETDSRRVFRIDGDSIDCVLASDRKRSVDRRTLIERGEVITELPKGDVQLADYADANDIDLTVTATQSRRSLGEYVFGSAMKRSLTATTTPTLVVQSNTEATRLYPYNSVLVLLDGRDDATKQVKQGAEIAVQYDATLHLLSVVNGGVLGTSAWSNAVIDQLETETGDAVDKAAAVGANAGANDIVTSVESGTIVTEVQSYATSKNIDLVIIGENLEWNLTERIIRTVPIPVLYMPSDSL
jgi:nucleotide-binding universal stress UspA family protein